MTDFFISYTGVDVAWARWIASVLERAGFTTTYQERDFPAGFSFVGQIQSAVDSAAQTIVVLSPEYFKSKWCGVEWHAAMKTHVHTQTAALLPVRVRKCDIPGILQPVAYIDLNDSLDAFAASALVLSKVSPLTKTSTAPAPYPR